MNSKNSSTFSLASFAKLNTLTGEMEAQPMTADELKAEMVSLLVQCAILPDTKVSGVDMFGRPGRKSGLKGLFEKRVADVKKVMGVTLLEEMMAEYVDKIAGILDQENDLHRNEEVDDIAIQMLKIDAEKLDVEFNTHHSHVAHVWGSADEGQKRHDRMVMRLAVVDKLANMGDEGKELKALVNDSLVERLMNGEESFDVELKPFVVTKLMLKKKEAEILSKNNAAYFRKKLEDKANTLREFSYRAERMMGFTTGPVVIVLDKDFVNMVIKLANKTKQWCEGRQGRPAPYSGRAVNALYNEAVQTLHALGKFNNVFLRKEWKSEEFCSFSKKTAADMVDVKSGANWADEMRICLYEQGDGNKMVSVRGSGD